ncbi:hypothetical protein AAKU55_003824 [Oxalobacteraceae bacterium GrIS 1.11]
MNRFIYDKTDKGREEIATRKYLLPSRTRTLLVMIDGRQSADELLTKVIGLGLTEDKLLELHEQGFIAQIGIDPTPAAAPAPVKVAPIAAPVAVPAPPPPPAAASQNGDNFQTIYDFYNQTIKSTIGLRGYGLQLKVERAASLEDFRALRKPYLEAILKTKGLEMARSLRNRLDELLGGKPEFDTVMMPDD